MTTWAKRFVLHDSEHSAPVFRTHAQHFELSIAEEFFYCFASGAHKNAGILNNLLLNHPDLNSTRHRATGVCRSVTACAIYRPF